MFRRYMKEVNWCKNHDISWLLEALYGEQDWLKGSHKTMGRNQPFRLWLCGTKYSLLAIEENFVCGYKSQTKQDRQLQY